MKPADFRIGLWAINGKLRSFVVCPLGWSFIIEMVIPAALAVRDLICPQLEHACFTNEQPGVINEHLGPPPALILANLAYHENRPYLSRLHMSNPVTMNYPAIKDPRFLMAHFKPRPQAGFLILNSPANRIKHPIVKSTIFRRK